MKPPQLRDQPQMLCKVGPPRSRTHQTWRASQVGLFHGHLYGRLYIIYLIGRCDTESTQSAAPLRALPA